MKRAYSGSDSEASEPKRRRATPPNSPQEGGAAALLVRCNASASDQGMRVALQKGENASLTREEVAMLKCMNLPISSDINSLELAPMLLSQSESNSQPSDTSFSSTHTASTVILISDDEGDVAGDRRSASDGEQFLAAMDTFETTEATSNTTATAMHIEAVTHALAPAPVTPMLAQPVRTKAVPGPSILRAFNRDEIPLVDIAADAALAAPTTTRRDATGTELTAEVRTMYDAHEARQDSAQFYSAEEDANEKDDSTRETTKELLKETGWGYDKYDAERTRQAAHALMPVDGPSVVVAPAGTKEHRLVCFGKFSQRRDGIIISHDVRAAERESDLRALRKQFDAVKTACKTGATTRSPTRGAKSRAQAPDNISKWRDQRAAMEAYQDAIGAEGHEAVARRADGTDAVVAARLTRARENATVNERDAEVVNTRTQRFATEGWGRRELRDKEPLHRAKPRAGTGVGQGEKKKHSGRK